MQLSTHAYTTSISQKLTRKDVSCMHKDIFSVEEMVPRGQLKCQQVDDGFPPQLFKHLTPGSAVTRVPSPFNNKIFRRCTRTIWWYTFTVKVPVATGPTQSIWAAHPKHLHILQLHSRPSHRDTASIPYFQYQV